MSVHPHTRGDHVLAWGKTAGGIGSPPHAWGPQHRSAESQGDYRFTPTRVGTTMCGRSIGVRHRFTPTRVGTTEMNRSACPLAAVHPHTRGDHVQGDA